MKIPSRSIAVLSAILTALTAVAPCHATDRAATLASSRTHHPVVVSAKTSLSPQQIARYQQRASQSRQATQDKAAGASSTAVWVVLGVAAVVGVIALASGGGGGGGGY